MHTKRFSSLMSCQSMRASVSVAAKVTEAPAGLRTLANCKYCKAVWRRDHPTWSMISDNSTPDNARVIAHPDLKPCKVSPSSAPDTL